MGIEDLSSRELQVWKGIVEGKSMREMAEDMGTGINAVWFAAARLDYKLGISDELENRS